jgi:hypothetical protein
MVEVGPSCLNLQLRSFEKCYISSDSTLKSQLTPSLTLTLFKASVKRIYTRRPVYKEVIHSGAGWKNEHEHLDEVLLRINTAVTQIIVYSLSHADDEVHIL